MRKVFLIVIICSIAHLAYGQFNLGIKAGYNSSLTLSSMSSISKGEYNLNSVRTDLRNNFHAGAFMRFGLGKKAYFQPELLYSIQKKDYMVSTFDVATGADVKVDKLVKVSTVELPLLLGYKLLDLKILNLRAFAGPKFKFDAGSSLEFNNITGGNLTIDNLKSDFKKAKLGLEIGAGVDVLMLTLDIRYNLIGNMYETKLKDVSLKTLPSSTLLISLGWKLF